MSQKTLFLLLGLFAVVASAAAAYATTKQHDKIVSCYYSSWAFYRPGLGKFDIDDIDPDLCTHGFYGFADMDNITWQVYSMDPWFDLAPSDCGAGLCNYDGYRRFVALKERNPNFVPMLSLGGWNAGSGKFSVMCSDPVKRRTFIDSIVPFLKKYGFGGLDFDWEYPGIREGANATIDLVDFDKLAEELSAALKPEGLLLTSALGMGYDKVLVGYDMPTLSRYFDFFNLMGYDFHGAWHNFTGHNSPLYHREEEFNDDQHPGYRYNIYDAIELYFELGTPAEKMVLGMPSYGRGFELIDPASNGLYCKADRGFPMGPYTRQRGVLGYLEIRQLFVNDTYTNLPGAVPGDWTVVVDDCYMAPYMYNDQYWMGYDDPESIAMKVRYANLRGLAGAMVWSLETDDFGGFYSDVKYPILERINQELAAGLTYDPMKVCGSAPICDGPFPTAAPPMIPKK
jgi:chitinase